MPSSSYDPQDDATLKGALGAKETRAFVAHYYAADPALGTTTAVHASAVITQTGQTVSTSITNPDFPRNLTVTMGGTAGDIATGTVTVYGTNVADATISEEFTTTANTAETLTGSKAFKTVTSYVITAQDGAAAECAVGTGAKLGLYHCLGQNAIVRTLQNNTVEGTAPTLAASTTAVESNTATLNTALDGNDVDIWYFVDGDE